MPSIDILDEEGSTSSSSRLLDTDSTRHHLDVLCSSRASRI